MREVKELRWVAAGGATYVADVWKCPDWTTCDFTGDYCHYHGAASVAGPNVPLRVIGVDGHSKTEVFVAMALDVSLALTFDLAL